MPSLVASEALSSSPMLKLKISLIAWSITTLAATLALTLSVDPRVVLPLILLALPLLVVFMLRRPYFKRRSLHQTFTRRAYLKMRHRSVLEKVIDLVAFDIRQIADKEYYEKTLTKYFLSMEKYVRLARENIVVLDYLAHHRSFNAIKDPELARSYESYFKVIEGQVIERGLFYTRIMQLPLGEIKALSRDELIYRCVELMFSETLEHIKRLYDSTCDFQLYILGTPLRPYSYMIIDNMYLLSEYERYDRSNVSLPDHLIVDRADSGNRLQDMNVKLLIEHHLTQLEAIVLTKVPVSLEEIQEATLRLEFNNSDLAIQSRAPEEKEKIRKGIEKKKAVFSAPSPGPEADT